MAKLPDLEGTGSGDGGRGYPNLPSRELRSYQEFREENGRILVWEWGHGRAMSERLKNGGGGVEEGVFTSKAPSIITGGHDRRMARFGLQEKPRLGGWRDCFESIAF